jgi:hypothetical protein
MKNCPLRRLSKGAGCFCWRVRVLGLFNKYSVVGNDSIVVGARDESFKLDRSIL